MIGVIFICLLPLFFLSGVFEIYLPFKKRYRYFYTFIILLLTNLLCLSWIHKASPLGYWIVSTVSAFLQSLPFLLLLVFSVHFKKIYGRYFFFLVTWMSIEYFQHKWELGFPYLSLGNVFSFYPQWVQWYAYTGVGGGSLWIICVNLLLYESLRWFLKKQSKYGYYTLSVGISLVLLPVFISKLVLWKYEISQRNKQTQPLNVVLVQPNFKFQPVLQYDTVQKNIAVLSGLLKAAVRENTDLIILPESSFEVAIANDSVPKSSIYDPILGYLNKHNSIVVGSTSFVHSKPTISARFEELNIYNIAILFNKNYPTQIRHKYCLVPGSEYIPNWLRFISPVFSQFYQFNRSFSKDDAPNNVPFILSDKTKLATAICYENMYGETIRKQVAEGANLIAIITNNAWFDSTVGINLLFQLNTLRSIENRKFLLQCSMDGVTGVIDDKGQVISKLRQYTPETLNAAVFGNNALSFYAKYGDVLYPISVYLFCVFFITKSCQASYKFLKNLNVLLTN